jgi:hypothetical protein
MEILIDDHAEERATERGATEEEINDILRSGKLTIAKGNRISKRESL